MVHPAAPMATGAPRTSEPGAPHLLSQQLHGHRAGHRIRREGLGPAREGAVPLHSAWEGPSGVGKQRSGHGGSSPLPRRHGELGETLAGGTDGPSRSRARGGVFSPGAWAPGPACLGHTLGPFSLASESPSVKWRNPWRGRVVGGAPSILRAGGREEALPAPGGTVRPDAQAGEGRQSSGCPSTPPHGKLVALPEPPPGSELK